MAQPSYAVADSSLAKILTAKEFCKADFVIETLHILLMLRFIDMSDDLGFIMNEFGIS